MADVASNVGLLFFFLEPLSMTLIAEIRTRQERAMPVQFGSDIDRSPIFPSYCNHGLAVSYE